MTDEMLQAIKGLRDALAASEVINFENRQHLELALGRMQGAADNVLAAAK